MKLYSSPKAPVAERISELSDAQLVALALGTPGRNLTHSARLVTELAREPVLDLPTLMQITGLGSARAQRLLATLELGRRTLLGNAARRSFLSHHDVFDWALPRLVHLEHEELWLLSLDARNQLKRAERVAQGGVTGCAVTPRDVLRPAVRNAAAALIVVHNHPSGDPTPSDDDLQMTEHLARGCAVLGFPLVDHVVVAREGARSIAALGVCDAA